MSQLGRLLDEYFVRANRALESMPHRGHLDIHKEIGKTHVTRPKVALWAPTYSTWSPYGHALIERLLTFGFVLKRIYSLDESKHYDLTINVGTDFLGLVGQIEEIPNAVEILGLDYFAHIRIRTIRKTVEHFYSLRRTAESMADELSIRTAHAIIADQLSGLPLHIFEVSMGYDTQYFGSLLFNLSDNETVFDVGAADGDSLVKFVKIQPRFEKYIGFEPDPALFAQLQKRVAEGQWGGDVVIESVVVADNSRPYRFNPTGNRASRIDDAAGVTIRDGTTIDDYAVDVVPTLIKIDTEGAEFDILTGAKATIEKYKPKLLISVYHNIEDLYRIPDLIRSIRPDYKLHLRHHPWAQIDTSWPGAFFCETVLYAI
jgi:FkbM family methyltransferase